MLATSTLFLKEMDFLTTIAPPLTHPLFKKGHNTSIYPQWTIYRTFPMTTTQTSHSQQQSQSHSIIDTTSVFNPIPTNPNMATTNDHKPDDDTTNYSRFQLAVCLIKRWLCTYWISIGVHRIAVHDYQLECTIKLDCIIKLQCSIYN